MELIWRALLLAECTTRTTRSIQLSRAGRSGFSSALRGGIGSSPPAAGAATSAASAC